MTPEAYTLLYEKYLAGNCTAAEIELLAKYRDGFRMQDGELLPGEAAVKGRVYKRISQTLFEKPKIINFRLMWAAAAILLVMIGAGIVFMKKRSVIPLTAKVVIKPGRNTAVLILADGTELLLDNAKDGTALTAVAKKIKSGEISYYQAEKTAPVVMNTLSIPKGGQYQVTLADGTKVWLNSVSSLTYPTGFAGNERLVELKGEAYFEVAHNEKMPFKVKTNGAEVEVLGTHFNIAAYEGEPESKTTLVAGSVRLSGKNSVIKLIPGEQGVINDNSDKITVKQVKAAEVVAWKNGSFVFRHANIQEIMKQISRWYDVDVEYRGNIGDRYFGGTYSKYKDITELLKGLELTGLIHFKMEGRRIIAMP
ncbi:FecR domain-containing protein [Mucilaginibacter sp.]|uniref:FecR family protein n=1 Tax=Mucilaginibacter sp. TaxID=1882438 RepID=UPI00262681B3|nr:FecR domain-containing protein [Mucilaginibacter sp.]MDB4926404.1 hypothetical protein [Mucilaginibacter sp.]